MIYFGGEYTSTWYGSTTG